MLTNWLSSISSDYTSTFFNSSFENGQPFPLIKDAKIVVFFRAEHSGNEIRKAFSRLQHVFDYNIVDIGHIKTQGVSAIYQVISELEDGHILPILVGISKSEFVELCYAMNKELKLHQACFVSNEVCQEDHQSPFHITNVGFQRHLVPSGLLDHVYNEQFNAMSLGYMRSNQRQLEPIIRECNYLHFDLAAIRRGDLPDNQASVPTGLTIEEGCQIMRYSGESNDLKLVTFDTNSMQELSNHTALVIAELCWYLFEGVSLKTEEHPSLSDQFNQYIVQMNNMEHSITFVKSKKTGRWWFMSNEKEPQYISCSYEEYESTRNEDIPERLLRLI